jgi:hypothetical protein
MAWNRTECFSLAAVARRYAVRAGDAQVAARVHLTFARLEARIGNFDTAIRHHSIARQVLETDNCLWISAALNFDQASVSWLLGDYEAAITLTQRAASESTAGGWTKGLALAAMNLGYFFVMLGREKDANDWLRVIPQQCLDHPTYRVAICETVAQAEYSKRCFQRSQELIDGLDFTGMPGLRWYEVSCQLTK